MPIDQGSLWSLKNDAPSLLIGVPEIDDEHDELIRQLDHLRGDPDALLESERFSEVLSQLGAQINRTIWVAPGVNADIAHETLVRLNNGRIEQNDRQELVAVTRR